MRIDELTPGQPVRVVSIAKARDLPIGNVLHTIPENATAIIKHVDRYDDNPGLAWVCLVYPPNGLEYFIYHTANELCQLSMDERRKFYSGDPRKFAPCKE